MPIWLIIILDLAVFYFFFGNTVLRLLQSKPMRRRSNLKDILKRLRQRLLRDEDILEAEHRGALQTAIAELEEQLASKHAAEQEKCLRRYESGTHKLNLPPPPTFRWLRDNLEVLVVALGLAFGIRALFVQPFKIPTGSMQPTLYGIHFSATEKTYAGNALQKFFSFLNYSERHLDLTVKEAGRLNFSGIKALPAMPFFPKSLVQIGSHGYELPGSVNDIQRMLYEKYGKSLFGDQRYFRANEIVLRGAIKSGDHLFVNRLTYCFREPKRGDVIVFVTDGLDKPPEGDFGGRYYIKRLVGLPGDELLIKEHQLYIKTPGAKEFRLLDANDSPGFARMHSHTGGFRGYAHMPGARYLRHSFDSFKVPKGHYFMLGDNSENSLDSRYWGTVPRDNLVGTALWVWWPFSRRWGLVDRVAPLPHETLPNLPSLPR